MAGAPALLFLGDYYGTLASARCLGERGIHVTLADPRRLVRTAASRFVARRVTCPPADQVESFVAWLEDYGRKNPGTVLFPASDALAWIFAVHRARLEERFRMYQPSRDVITHVLDKWRLTQSAWNVGMETPRTWCPETDDGLVALAAEVTLPVLIKPRAQILVASRSKGDKVGEGQDVVREYRRFLGENPAPASLRDGDAILARPILQEYRAEAERGIYSLAGFIDASGSVVTMLASQKILQRPRNLGIGLCFEAAPVRAELRASIEKLCKELGYYGIFEVEMIERDGRFLLIDFNPRPYSQMAFEMARGLPLPHLHYLAATGDHAALAKAAADASTHFAPATAYAHTFLLRLVMAGQRAAGGLGGAKAEPWQKWIGDHRVADAVFEGRDPLPAIVDVASHLEQFARHPRSFLRSLMR